MQCCDTCTVYIIHVNEGCVFKESVLYMLLLTVAKEVCTITGRKNEEVSVWLMLCIMLCTLLTCIHCTCVTIIACVEWQQSS